MCSLPFPGDQDPTRCRPLGSSGRGGSIWSRALVQGRAVSPPIGMHADTEVQTQPWPACAACT